MALVNPNIALGIRQPEFTPRNAMAEYAQMQQVMNAQDAQQMNALKMQEARDVMTERNALRRLNPSASDFEDQLFRVNPTLGIQYRKERSAAEASAAAAAASRAAAEKSGFELSASRRKFGEDLKRGLSANPSDENIVAFGQDAVLQGLYSKDQVEATVGQLLAMPREERVRVLSQAGASAEALKPNIQQVNQGGQTQVLRVPAFGGKPTVAGTYADVALPADVQAQKVQKAAASAPNITVSTEKKYGERFGGLIADRDAGKLDAAESAPRVIENSDRIMDILATGKVFTGTGANVRLQLAKALNLAGGTDTDRIANTEVLISSLANSTLGAIKSSNLGAGQGFTNADRDFLEKASAGQLTYDSTSLRKLAELGRKAGVASIESWNSRVQQIPKAALEGLGIPASPLPVPSRRPASVMNIPQGAIDMLKSGAGTREQFDSTFGPGSAARILKGN